MLPYPKRETFNYRPRPRAPAFDLCLVLLTVTRNGANTRRAASYTPRIPPKVSEKCLATLCLTRPATRPLWPRCPVASDILEPPVPKHEDLGLLKVLSFVL